jgi:4-carboxymuconolactone decarboxylase
MRTAALLAVAAALLVHSAGPRLAPVPEGQQTDEQKKIAAQFASEDMPNAVATYLHQPSLARDILPNEHYVSSESTLAARDRALVALRTAWLTHSTYLWAHYAAGAKRAGLTDDEPRRVAQGPDAEGWNSFEAALLRAADELHVDSFVSDATWHTLAERYDVNQLVDLIYGVGDITMHAGALNSLGVEIETPFRDQLPPRVRYHVAARRTNVRLLGKEPRIPPVEAAQGRANGNVFRTFVRNPPADRLRGAVTTHIRNASTLSPRHRELLLMRIGALCRSEYEWAAHSRIGKQTGMTDADVERIATGGRLGDPADRALMRAADELFQDDRVSDGTWAELGKSFDTKQLLDMLIAVGGYRAVSMGINSAGVQLDANMAGFRFPASLR